MLISGRKNFMAVWISQFALGHLALAGKGRVRVRSGRINVLDDELLTFILSPLTRVKGTEDRTDS